MLYPDIDPIAFSIGQFPVRWYALAYLAGFLVGWRYVIYLIGLDRDKIGISSRLNNLDIDDFLPWAIIGVIVGGRLGYVLFYQTELYWIAPLDVLKVWHGGMSFHGGVLGVIVAMFAFTRYRKKSLLLLCDLMCCAAPIGLFFGRIANFINGELFGRVTEAKWGMVFPGGGPLPRHPSQLYEAALEGLLLFIILLALAHIKAVRQMSGILAGIFLIGYGISRIVIEFFREPDMQVGYILNHFTMGQVLSLPMVAAGIIAIVYILRSSKKYESA